MRYCVVELVGQTNPVLAVAKADGVVPLDAPASLRGALEQCGPDPRTFRDFYAFEQHVKTCREKRGQSMVPEWYEIPVFYFSNTGTLKGHLEPVKKPTSTNELDFELEVGCVIAKTGIAPIEGGPQAALSERGRG